MSRGRWDFFDTPPRRSVEGGVVVAKPGKVGHSLAADLVAAAEMESEPQILARGRTYARAGQVVAVQARHMGFSAQIQGTDARPYQVRLDRTTISGSDRVAADCTCPYGCDYGWCKHAAALAYVAAFLLDRDPAARAAWTGTPATTTSPDPGSPGTIADIAVVPASALTLNPEDLATLREPVARQDPHELLTAAQLFVPHPWRPVEPTP